jgi:membrane protease YdiL (CAAX protease family)
VTSPDGKRASKRETPSWFTWLVLAFAMLFPSVMAWLAFALVPPGQSEASKVGPVAYYGGKVVQFSLPIVFLLLTTGRLPLPSRPSFRGASLGVAFGLLTAGAIIGLYHVFLRDSRIFRQSPGLIQAKLAEFGLDSPLGFAGIAGFITILHSLLEEYYWRWFVFGQLRRSLPFVIAMLLSSFFFAAFHAFSLSLYLPGHLLSAVLPFTACVGIGGGIWCWLYERTGSVYAPWISHLLVDASLFVVGYDLCFVRGSSS